jgi:hypothetical protein
MCNVSDKCTFGCSRAVSRGYSHIYTYIKLKIALHLLKLIAPQIVCADDSKSAPISHAT